MRIGPDEVSIADLAACKTIHHISSGFVKSDWYATYTLDKNRTPGLFGMSDPKEHAQRRKLFAHPMSNTSILKLEPMVRAKVDMAVHKIKRDATKGVADIARWFTYLATDVIGHLSFGKSFEMLETEKVGRIEKHFWVCRQ